MDPQTIIAMILGGEQLASQIMQHIAELKTQYALTDEQILAAASKKGSDVQARAQAWIDKLNSAPASA